MTDDLTFWRRRSGRRYAIAIVANLAIGIAGVTAVWSVWRTTLLSQGLATAQRQVFLMAENKARGYRLAPAAETLRLWRDRLESYDVLAGLAIVDATMRTDAGGEAVRRASVTRELFELGRLVPVAGRVFDEEELRSLAPVAMVSERLARQVAGASRGALGRSLTLDGQALTIVGVLPDRFDRAVSPSDPIDVLTPLDEARHDNLQVFARLREGTTVEQAQAELAAWTKTQAPELRQGGELSWVVLPSSELTTPQTRRMLRAAVIGGLVLLLVTASNVAHLLIAKSGHERREVATRWALGAGRSALLGWRLKQASILTVVAGLVAVALSAVALEALTRILPEPMRFLALVDIDLATFVFAVVLAFLIVFVSGVLPVVLADPRRLGDELRTQYRLGRRSRFGRLLGDLHVVTMVASALVLGVAAYLVIATVLALGEVDPGFDADGLHVVQVELPEWRYAEPAHRAAYFDHLTERLETRRAGVELALASFVPPQPAVVIGELELGGDAPGQGSIVALTFIDAAYLRVMRHRLLAGRPLFADDVETGAPVAIVSAAVAQQLGGDLEAALGQRLRVLDNEHEVVGVVADLEAPRRSFGGLHLYLPLSDFRPSTQVLVRGTDRAAAEVLSVVRALDPDLAVETRTMDALLASTTSSVRFLTTLFSILSAIAIGLAVGGVYAILSSFAVEQRSQIALRMAMGASAREVGRWVVWQGLSKSLVGIAIGVLVSYPFSRLLADQLFGLAPTSTPARVTAVALVLALTALVTLVPAIRASRIDPNEVLRST